MRTVTYHDAANFLQLAIFWPASVLAFSPKLYSIVRSSPSTNWELLALFLDVDEACGLDTSLHGMHDIDPVSHIISSISQGRA